ncbi:MAG: hypothetical protein CMK00_01730 [Planctomycetes bacterium]|nr:hypothetical protein [Planctomycetota bacterium]
MSSRSPQSQPPEEKAREPSEATPAAEEAFFEFLDRVQAGETLRIEDLCAAHPADAPALLRMYDDWAWLAGLVEKERREREEELLGEGREVDPGEFLERLREHGPSDRRYRVECEINRGGMGRVLKIWDEDLGRPLAMKIVDTSATGGSASSSDGGGFKPRSEPGSGGASRPLTEAGQRALSRFLDEARITGRLEHPSIISAHEVGVDDEGNPYFTMPWVRGRDLRKVFRLLHLGEEDWTLPRIIAVLVQVCDAMAFAHSRGVLHRDLKPANIMVGRFGETHVMDWGLARVLGRRDTLLEMEADENDPGGAAERGGGAVPPAERPPESWDAKGASAAPPPAPPHSTRPASGTSASSQLSTRAGAVLGTVGYMSPEQARGELNRLGPRSDVYSLGAILYHLLAGAPPHVTPGQSASSDELLARTLAGPPPAPSRRARRGQGSLPVPPELEAICAKAMARHPLDRYEGMAALARDLRAWLEGRVVDAYESGLWAELRKWLARHRAASLAAGLLLAVGAAWGAERIITQGRHVAEITGKNTDLEIAYRETSVANSALGLARDEAQHRAGEAHYQSYLGHLSAAEAMLQMHRVTSAAEHLSRCPEELRGWEWSYLSSRLDDGLGSLFEAGGMINDVAWSRDGKYLALASTDGLATVFSAEGTEPAVNLTGHEGPLRSVAFSPDGREVATASEDATARIWRRADGAERLVLRGHRSGLWGADFSPDGALLSTCSGDGRVIIWNPEDGRELMSIASRGVPVWSARFSPGGDSLATAGEDGWVHIYNLETGAEQFALDTKLDPELPSRAWPLAWHPGGQLLATGHASGSVSIWRPGRRDTASHIASQGSPIRAIAFSPDGRRLATGAEDTTIRLWDVFTGRRLGTLHGHDSSPRALVFNPDGQRLLSGGADRSLRLWLAEDPEVNSKYLGHASCIRTGRFLPDGRRFVTAAGDRTLAIWEVGRADPIRVLRKHREPVYALTVAHKKHLFASGSSDRSIIIWDADTYADIARLTGHSDSVLALAFSPDETLLASAARDGTARLWDVESAAHITTLACAGSACSWVSFSPDGKRLLTSTAEGILEAWDPLTGASLPTGLSQERGLRFPTFDPTGRLLATLSPSHTVHLWEVQSGELLAELVGHGGPVYASAFTPDSQRLLTTSRDRSMRLWDVSTGQQVGSFLGHGGSVWGCDVSPDGARFLSLGDDHLARIWEAADPRRRLRERQDLSALQGRALPLIEGLLRDGWTPEQVADRLATKVGLSSEFRREAQLLAHQLGELPRHLNRRARDVGLVPGLDAAAYTLAGDEIQAAILRDPANEDYRHTLALIALRQGHDQLVLRLLGRQVQVERGAPPCEDLLHALVLSQAHASLGNAPRAREEWDLVAGKREQPFEPGLELTPLVEELLSALEALDTGAETAGQEHQPIPGGSLNGQKQ